MVSAFFDYTKAGLAERLRSGVSLEAMKADVRRNAITLACRPGTELAAFVSLGGALQFEYLFADAAHFLTVDVDRCAPR